MKKSFAFALSLALAMVTLLCGAAPSAFAASNLIRTVSTKNSPALDCTASLLNQYSASASNLCWSGTNTSNYAAFSLKALEAGAQTFPFVTNTAPTLELYNDTASTTVSVKLAGNMGANQPISCQGTAGSTGCEISGPLGTFNSQMRPDGIAVYPGSSSTGVTVTFFGVPLNSYVGLQWDSWKSTNQTVLSFGGQVANYLGTVSSCSGNAASTTVTGTVYAPNGVDPLPNALVYVPAAAPGALNSGVECAQANATPQGGAITSTVSATDGSFTLTGVPAGANIPVIIQVGKWRIQRTIATVAPCSNNVLSALSTTLPSNQFAGDMPKIAVMTGAKDAIECVLRKTGVADSEFTNNNGNGRIHIYLGGGNSGARIDASTPGQEALVGSEATLSNYDMVLLPSQGAFYPQTASDLANIYQWANSGGRLFASHDSVTWLANNPANGVGFGAAAQWDQLQANASASTQLTFNTPVGVAAANQCGRVLYVAHPAVDANANGTTFPEECNASPMTSDERRMEYSLFDLSNATTSPVAPSASSSLASGSSLSKLAAVSSSSSLCGGLPCATAHDASTPTSPLGIANAYNLIALKGDISDTADIMGRIAAAGQVTLATTVGTALRDGDPFVASASENGGPWAIVAAAGIPTSNSFNVNAGGNVYSLTPTAANFNFVNEEYTGSIYSGSTLVTGGTSPIDFSALSTGISNLSSQLSSATVNGLICSVDSTGSMIPDNGCPANPVYFNATSQHYNPSWLVLYGTDPTTNVFNLTQAQFESSINNLDIEIPTGSTAIINVAGTDVTLHTDVYFQGSTVTDVNAATILFNFANATKVTINGQLDGAVLAPNAALSGLSQMGGVFIAASIGATGEVHYIPFTGTIPTGGTSTPLSVTCAATTTGEVGMPFNSGAMTVSGGTAPYTFSIIGTLPAGLTLNTATGAVTGTPTASGSFSVKVTDAAGASSNGCAITINPTLSATCAAVTAGQVGVPFNSGAMTVSGGTAPYTFSVVGTLPAGLTLNTSTGAVTGTPTASATFSVKVADANGVSSEGCAITISSSLSVTCAAVTSGEVGVPFDSGPMTVTGGTTPYTYSVVGTLPAGLTLNTSTGAVTGTPTASGSFSVKVTDANGASSTGCAITINSALSVTCAAITKGEVGVPFNSGAMSVSGGTAPYTYSVVGTLPAGLTLNTSTGAVTGTPTASGSFSVKVTDANGASSTGCAITINTALSVSCAAVTTGEVGVAFNSGAMTVSGGTAPYTYSVVGTLPAGLTLNTSTGAVTGTPTAAGTFSVKVTDANGASSSSCAITINSALSVACAAIKTGEVGVAFNSGPMTVTGGTSPYTYSIVGTLPAGLSLNTSTGAVTGTPTASGSFSVKVTDANGASSSSCAITINPALNVACAAINAGQVGVAFNSGAMTVSGGTAPYTYSVVGTLPAGLTLNTSTGAVTGTPTSAGSFSIKVVDAGGASSSSCAITISAAASLSIVKSADSANIAAGSLAGFTVTISNPGTLTATGLTLSDALPAGAANDIHWAIDSNTGNPTAFTISGATGNQTLAFNGTQSLAPGASLVVHIVGATTTTGVLNNTAKVCGTNVSCAQSSAGILINAIVTGTVTTNALVSGDTATIGYWQNNNGQALILSMNGSANSTAFANWLATNFPYLYGVESTTDLTGKTNTDVAAQFIAFFSQSGKKTNAQVMAGAIATYVTNIGLAGSNVASTKGFNTSVTGTGTKTLNVGSDGSSAGLTNSKTYTVMQLLQQANLQVQNGTFDSTTFNDIFTDINEGGDVGSGNNTTAVTFTCPTTTSGALNVAFNSGAITVSGGTAPYTFSVVGTLPAGLSLNTSTGAVTGTPTASGSFSLKVTDSKGATATGCTFNIGAGYNLTVNPSTVTVVAGQTATTTFTFSPFGGYTGTVNFSCSGLPVGAACTFSPSSLTANGLNTVQTSTLTITTTANGTVSIAENRTSSSTTLASIFLLPGMLLGGFIGWRRRSLKGGLGGVVLLMLFAVMIGGAVGCGSGLVNTPTGTQQVKVVAKTAVSATTPAGSMTEQTADFTLIITQ